MTLLSQTSYGYANCPHCISAFNLAKATGTFSEAAPNGDTLVYVMCPDCHSAFNSGDKPVMKAMSNQCFINFKVKLCSKGVLKPHWAITSLFSLHINNNNLVNAIEHGHGLPRHIYDGLLTGEIQALPLACGGFNIVFSHTVGSSHD